MRGIYAVLLCLFLAAAPAAAQEPVSTQTRLRFYSHPTERFNVLIPGGWDNLSDEQGAHFANTNLRAQIYVRAFVTEDVDAAVAQAAALLPAQVESTTSGDDVRLVTGSWSQRFFRLLSGAAASAFVQIQAERAFVILYVSETGAIPLVVRTDALVMDTVSAQSALARARGQLSLDLATTRELTLSPSDAATMRTFAGSFATGNQSYAALVRGVSDTAADVLIEPGTAFTGDHTIVYSIIRDFFLTPDTVSYLWLGLAAVFVVMIGFVAGLIVRQRNLRADEAALVELSQP